MSSGDSARTFYESARQELIQRIQLRDNVLLVYLGAIGTIFSVSLGTTVKPEILLVIPYLALGASVIVSQHNAVIGSLGIFLVFEIGPFLQKLKEGAPQWDNSASLHEYSTRAIWMRSFGHFLLIIVPPVAALSINWQSGFYGSFPENPIWWVGVLSTVASIYIIIEAHYWRKKLFKKIKWKTF
jgi:hypothetical protein